MQYILYKLTWDAVKSKYSKQPVTTDRGEIWRTDNPDDALVRCSKDVVLGIWLNAADGMWFIDLDDAVVDGKLDDTAARLAAPFVQAGCYFEASSSGRGAHIIGHYSGSLPEHSNRRPLVHKYEFYTRDRGVALNSAASQGSWDVDATALLPGLLTEWFPPRAAIALRPPSAGPRAEWRGPTDDGELVRRMLSATGSAAARLSGKLTIQQLWAGQCEHNSESDMALASHLAFWTGCDEDRMERLMRQSALARDKWFEHRTYLRDITIAQAARTTATVYQEPMRVDTATAVLGAPGVVPVATEVLPVASSDWHSVVDSCIAAINDAGTYKHLSDVVIPSLAAYGLPRMHGERVVSALARKLELFDAKLPLATLRALVMPPVQQGLQPGAAMPQWLTPMVYVTRTDTFYDTVTGRTFSHESFRMEYNRHMPLKPTGAREDAVAQARDKWQVMTVDDLEYRPDMPPTFEHDGKRFANVFLPSSLPTPVAGSPECVECIGLLQQHLYLMVDQDDKLYWAMLHWIAHNVQYPGVKIRWSPLVKGVPGDGKSIFGDLFFAVLSGSNVKITSPATLTNGGGFTDWASGKAVNIIEEIYLEGQKRRWLYNMMKIFIGDDRIELNQKGRASKGALVNVTNHWANTNHEDAVPIEDGERRWGVIFTPWSSADEAARRHGLPDANALPQYFARLGRSMRAEPGAWRAWLLGIDLSTFDPNDRAPDTKWRQEMKVSTLDFIEETILDAINAGGPGISVEAFSSQRLRGRVKILLGEDVEGRQWNRILRQLGYRQHEVSIWFDKTSHRVWSKTRKTLNELQNLLLGTC